MTNRSRLTTISAVPLAVLLATGLAGVPRASAVDAGGEVDATGNSFTYRAASVQGSDSSFTARLSQDDSGGYDLSVTPEGITFTGNCGLPSPVEQAQVYVCSTPGTPTTALFGNMRGTDDIDLSALANVGKAPFTAPAIIRTGGGSDTITTSGVIADVDAGKGRDLIDTEVTRGDVSPSSTPGGDVHGGKGIDTVTYVGLVGLPIRISLDGLANDGRLLEKDNIHDDVENVIGPKKGFKAVGSAKANVLTGGNRGDDDLVGRGGRDTLIGRNGDDRLDARDGRAGDVVSCGGGRDRVLLDRGDTMVSASACERVVRVR